MSLLLSNYVPALKYGAIIDVGGAVDPTGSSISIVQNMSNGDTSKPLSVTGTPTLLTGGARQGAIFVGVTRASTSALTSWDGNPDAGIKVQARNNAANGSNGATRGLDINARNTGTESWVQGALISATNSSGTVPDVTGATFITDQGGTSTNTIPLIVQDVSQGTSTNTYGIRITTGTINPASGARAAAINFAAKDTAGFSNAFYFEDGSGLEGAHETGTTNGAEAGYILVKIGSTVLRIKTFGNS